MATRRRSWLMLATLAVVCVAAAVGVVAWDGWLEQLRATATATLLLAGYAYAHVLARLPLKPQLLLHLALIAAALFIGGFIGNLVASKRRVPARPTNN